MGLPSKRTNKYYSENDKTRKQAAMFYPPRSTFRLLVTIMFGSHQCVCSINQCRGYRWK
ncbi:hypothetical protein FGIG_00473 [Fasciola gigantica]|uniref:Uncharacterized protein n=1 Tax=Fasciola gigantica TaxID=46835 RepID=A0A504Z3N9_FASGI|nr:hypothetical protein FGIG_00473 [Fasciola gigantica]